MKRRKIFGFIVTDFIKFIIVLNRISFYTLCTNCRYFYEPLPESQKMKASDDRYGTGSVSC